MIRATNSTTNFWSYKTRHSDIGEEGESHKIGCLVFGSCNGNGMDGMDATGGRIGNYSHTVLQNRGLFGISGFWRINSSSLLMDQEMEF